MCVGSHSAHPGSLLEAFGTSPTHPPSNQLSDGLVNQQTDQSMNRPVNRSTDRSTSGSRAVTIFSCFFSSFVCLRGRGGDNGVSCFCHVRRRTRCCLLWGSDCRSLFFFCLFLAASQELLLIQYNSSTNTIGGATEISPTNVFRFVSPLSSGRGWRGGGRGAGSSV